MKQTEIYDLLYAMKILIVEMNHRLGKSLDVLIDELISKIKEKGD